MTLSELEPATGRPAGAQRRAGRRRLPGLEHGALAAILALSGLLEFVKLAQNGYANTFYSAAVKSMLRSSSNFFFVSADPNGLITVDKPPLALWVQGLSAKLFGFSPLSLLIPEGVITVLAVALLYRIVAPRYGRVAGLLSALALAVFPSFVAVGRDNGVDPLLILLMLAACGAAMTAIESARLRWLIISAVFVGLAFNTKSLAALLCVPGIAIGYLACAEEALRKRILKLAVAGVVLVAVAVSWSVAVDLTPASQRPFVGGSTNNTEFELDFGYNGLGRVGGQQGGPGSTVAHLTTQQLVPLERRGIQNNLPYTAAELRYRAAHLKPIELPPAPHVSGRARRPAAIPFGGTRSPVRIFATGMGDQAGWLVPLAVIGLIAAALVVRRRRDRRAGGLFVLGGWFLVELATLDFSAGIVHPYYASALGPGTAALAGVGAVALASLLRGARPLRGFMLAVFAVVGTVAAQLVLIGREGYPTWWRIPLVALALIALIAIPLSGRRSGWALGAAVAALVIAPLIYSFSVWLAPVDGTFPVAGPYNHAGYGGIDAPPFDEAADRGLIRFLRASGATSPYPLLTQSSDQAAPIFLLGLDASAEGGYGAYDPALSNTRLASLVAAGKARFLLISGPYADRGSNSAVTAARLVCPEVPEAIWARGLPSIEGGSFLVDCAGRVAQLRHPFATARAFLRAHPGIRYKL
ncbi:MAG TPA: glycosyltransferase family 39 protein [Solirubrobacteraceae bacterium]|jgi:4-amino-4-deoxy-L-arabinose transferase-like glycosyltransferase|nr:glycosyltransferase family 39 protein [Solirubrobacteraceae bacterium]